MSDDLLTRATKALRDSTDAADDGALTLARIERSLRAPANAPPTRSITRRRLTRFVAMPIAAVFLVLTAWASASGRLPHWLRLSSPPDTEHATPAPAPPPDPIAPSIPASASASALASASASALASAPALARAPASAPALARAPALAPAPAPAPDADSLYRTAHETHFSRHDYASAITAWDAYLASAGPTGRFTLEARYNRAVALVKTGRKSEARAALQPFADGEYGGYRRDEARELLLTLD
ncbi:MAG: hypothetical protein JWO86_2566 [Myxococcaceae bacterium]|nr:hypothetical protein [Myxococcaceae bacterium]